MSCTKEKAKGRTAHCRLLSVGLGTVEAGALGILGLPTAALLISVRLRSSTDAKRVALWLANLAWISVVLMFAAFVVMATEYFKAGGKMAAEVMALPPGVTALVGWANRFLVAVYCAWVIAVAWQMILPRRKPR